MEDKKDEHKQQGELHMWDPIDQVRPRPAQGRERPSPSRLCRTEAARCRSPAERSK